MILGVYSVGKILRILRYKTRVYLLSSQFAECSSEWTDLNDGVPNMVTASISNIYNNVFPIKTKRAEYVLAIIESALLAQLCLVFYAFIFLKVEGCISKRETVEVIGYFYFFF